MPCCAILLVFQRTYGIAMRCCPLLHVHVGLLHILANALSGPVLMWHILQPR